VVGEDPNDSDDRLAKNASDIPDYEWDSRENDLSKYDYLDQVLRNDWPISDFCNWLLDHGELNREQVHLTNQKKCSNIGGEDLNRSNARSNCQEYLSEEIDSLDPKVILLSGGEAIKGVNDLFDLSLSERPSTDAGDKEQRNGRVFVTSPNFGYAGMNFKRQECPYEGPEEFFTEVGELVSK